MPNRVRVQVRSVKKATVTGRYVTYVGARESVVGARELGDAGRDFDVRN